MKLVYWVSQCKCGGDEWCHHPTLRAKTHKDVDKIIKGRWSNAGYETPRKVETPEFTGSFDMLLECLKGAHWENVK